MLSWKQCALLVITTMALWQLMCPSAYIYIYNCFWYTTWLPSALVRLMVDETPSVNHPNVTRNLLDQDCVPKPDWAWNLSTSNHSQKSFTWSAHCNKLSHIWFINETWFYAINHHGELNAFDNFILPFIRLFYELELNFTDSFCVVISWCLNFIYLFIFWVFDFHSS